MNNNSLANDASSYILGWVLACGNKAPMYATIINVSKEFGLDQNEVANTINKLINTKYINTCSVGRIVKDDVNVYIGIGADRSWIGSNQQAQTFKDMIDKELHLCGLKIIQTLMTTSGSTPSSLMEAIKEHCGGTVLVAIDKALENNVIRLGDRGELHIAEKGLRIYIGIGK